MSHASLASSFTKNHERMQWHDEAVWFVRKKRDLQKEILPEWEGLREEASRIKTKVLKHQAWYLSELEKNLQARGAVVHWAEDAREFNSIVHSILKAKGVKKVVKSKSMLTEEMGLNTALEKNGIEIVDTDLGERIVQLRGEHPSHIVLPAIHLKKEDVSETFHKHLGTDKDDVDPTSLTRSARKHLREKFLSAEAGITGVNFACAEEGMLTLCTNEGNADLGIGLPKLHIACMGIEKVIPSSRELPVFLRLLARSATGQTLTSYTTQIHAPPENGEWHVVLVDNGRSKLSHDEEMAEALKCIRCGACMNTCPVYRRSGGHSYKSEVPGPIGSVLASAKDKKDSDSLPYACSLCGSCTEVCPVKIPLHHQLLQLRKNIVEKKGMSKSKWWVSRMAAWVLASSGRMNFFGGLYRLAMRTPLKGMISLVARPWTRYRSLPVAKQSFRDIYFSGKKKP